MAKYTGEEKSGKLGDVIYSSWNGRPYTRRRPEKVANPRTEAQQAHRSAFAEISRLSSAMKEGHSVGLHWQAVRQKLNSFSVFKKLNKDCYGADGIDYPRIRISYGGVSVVSITSAEIDAQGVIEVTFEGSDTTEDKSEKLWLYVFCPDLHEGLYARPVARSAGVVTAVIREEWKGHVLHLYAFVKDRKGRTSNTIYVGQFSVLCSQGA